MSAIVRSFVRSFDAVRFLTIILLGVVLVGGVYMTSPGADLHPITGGYAVPSAVAAR